MASRFAIIAALQLTQRTVWNVTAAAKRLGMPLSTLKYQMRRFAIGPPVAEQRSTMVYEIPALYDVARQICFDMGANWTDPRTGKTHKAPTKKPPTPTKVRGRVRRKV